MQNEEKEGEPRQFCESPFEREVFNVKVERGYRVVPQLPVVTYRIDMVIEDDTVSRFAIGCGGDRYQGLELWDRNMCRK